MISDLKIAIENENPELQSFLICGSETDLHQVLKTVRIQGYKNLQRLQLMQIDMTSKSSKALRDYFDTRLYPLQHLEIVNCPFSSADSAQCVIYRYDVYFPARSPKLSSLRNLPLVTLQIRFQASLMSEHRIFWNCLSAIKTLTELSLVYSRLTPDSCILLANELKNFKHLTKLDLEGNPILSVGAGILMTEEINLTYWGLRNCQIDRYCETNDKLVHDFIQHICKQVVYNPFLETIDLRDNCLNSSDYTEILVSYFKYFLGEISIKKIDICIDKNFLIRKQILSLAILNPAKS